MTAAPGPQQPDEECARACAWHNGLYWHETFCPCWRRGLLLCSCAQKTRPAAPSAQQCVWQRNGQDCLQHGPAEPVRDTEEGRRG